MELREQNEELLRGSTKVEADLNRPPKTCTYVLCYLVDFFAKSLLPEQAEKVGSRPLPHSLRPQCLQDTWQGLSGWQSRAPASLLCTHCPTRRYLMCCSGVRNNPLVPFAFFKRGCRLFLKKSDVKSKERHLMEEMEMLQCSA